MAQCNQGNSGTPYGGNPYAPGNPYSPGKPGCGDCYGPYGGFPADPDAPIDSECIQDTSDPCAQRQVENTPCPNAVCDDRFADLPPTKRMNIMGIVGRCFYRFVNSVGFIVSDQRGAYITNRPCIPIPFLKYFQTDPNDGTLLLDSEGDPLEGPVPKFDAILGTDECGCQNRVQGVKNKRQRPIWDGQAFCFVDDRDPDQNPLLDPKDVPIVNQDCPAPLHAVLIPTSQEIIVDGVPKIVFGYTIGGTYNDGIPVGKMDMWPGNDDAIPEGYMLCDGTSLNINEWAALFAVLGYSWGGSGNNFNIPDMRGRIPRGVDLGAGNDPDAADRIEINIGGNTGDAVGSLQEDAIQCFGLGTYQRYVVSATVVKQATAGSSTQVARFSNQYVDTAIEFVDTGCGDPRFSEETRPKNAYVNFIIRAGCPPEVAE